MKISITQEEYDCLLNYFADLKTKPCIGCENNDGSCCGCESEKVWSKTMAGYADEVKSLANVQPLAVYFDSTLKIRENYNRICLLIKRNNELQLSRKAARNEFVIIGE